MPICSSQPPQTIPDQLCQLYFVLWIILNYPQLLSSIFILSRDTGSRVDSQSNKMKTQRIPLSFPPATIPTCTTAISTPAKRYLHLPRFRPLSTPKTSHFSTPRCALQSQPYSHFRFQINATQPLRIQRNMASAPAKKEFLCILPDKPGVVEKRLEVRGYVSFPFHVIHLFIMNDDRC